MSKMTPDLTLYLTAKNVTLKIADAESNVINIGGKAVRLELRDRGVIIVDPRTGVVPKFDGVLAFETEFWLDGVLVGRCDTSVKLAQQFGDPDSFRYDEDNAFLAGLLRRRGATEREITALYELLLQ